MEEKDRWEQLQNWTQIKDARIDALMRGYALLSVRIEHLEKEMGAIPKPSIWNQDMQPPYGAERRGGIVVETAYTEAGAGPDRRYSAGGAYSTDGGYGADRADGAYGVDSAYRADGADGAYSADSAYGADRADGTYSADGTASMDGPASIDGTDGTGGRRQAYGRRRSRSQSRSQSRSRSQSQKKQHKAGKIIGNTAFYLSLVMIIVIALFVRAGSSGAPNSLAGYTGLIVLTESMQSEIPKGSLVITKSVDPATLEIGDDITFMANQTTTLTHRIVGITENYQNTGGRAFETQGVMNPQPDQQLVMEANLVGRVIFHSEVLGKVANIITGYWPVLILTMVVLFVLIHVLQRLNRPDEGSEE